MSDVTGARAGDAACDERCGCPYPCSGGASCRCATSGGEAEGRMDHKKCPCGDHCGCNPCSCGLVVAVGTGRANCRCGPGCTCITCAT
ncbi:metallothionein-like protein 4B [Rhodamnia argentea]|uniref:Metallothionein-like protein 4B n=1 Tax=Rhodamnia argentea TaxID=178133 RepID=A0A8B8QZQ0_9MYRT|nr:metallothionein-like protein 4B [Rhodamnia argentea]